MNVWISAPDSRDAAGTSCGFGLEKSGNWRVRRVAFLAYLAALTVTIAGRNTRSAMV